MYFNEFDPFAAQWLRNLYPTATVDEKDIRDVQPADVAGFRRCHFFGGIGGWQYALELAGWPLDREVWTGSCPCQPLSCAGKRKGEKDERHLWPEFYRLISERRPSVIFGEQVASPDGLEWLDGISLDLEELDYAIAACDLPAASVKAPHPRQRFFWVADAGCSDVQRRSRRHEAFGANGKTEGQAQQRERSGLVAWNGSKDGWMGDPNSIEQDSLRGISTGPRTVTPRGVCRVVYADCAGPFEGSGATTGNGYWSSSLSTVCIDGRTRRLSTQPGDEPLAHGIPRDLGQRFPELRPLAKGARANRVGRLRGYGNAIVPQVAATFIRAFMETEL